MNECQHPQLEQTGFRRVSAPTGEVSELDVRCLVCGATWQARETLPREGHPTIEILATTDNVRYMPTPTRFFGLLPP